MGRHVAHRKQTDMASIAPGNVQDQEAQAAPNRHPRRFQIQVMTRRPRVCGACAYRRALTV